MKIFPHLLGGWGGGGLIDSAYSIIYISSNLFADENCFWVTYDEIDTVSGYGVCTMLVIRQS